MTSILLSLCVIMPHISFKALWINHVKVSDLHGEADCKPRIAMCRREVLKLGLQYVEIPGRTEAHFKIPDSMDGIPDKGSEHKIAMSRKRTIG